MTTLTRDAVDVARTHDLPPEIRRRFETSLSREASPARFESPRLRCLGRALALPSTRTPLRARRTVILSVEGVLVDLREAEALSWLAALHEGDVHVQLDVLRQLSGLPPQEVLRVCTGEPATSTTGQALLARQQQVFRTWYLRRLRPHPGTKPLLHRMKAGGLRLVAVSSGSGGLLPDLIRASGVEALLDDAVGADGERMTAVLSRLANAQAGRRTLQPDVILLGDSPHHVQLGERTGISVVALHGDRWTAAALGSGLAVYRDAVHLLKEYSRSPFAGASRSMTLAPSIPSVWAR